MVLHLFKTKNFRIGFLLSVLLTTNFVFSQKSKKSPSSGGIGVYSLSKPASRDTIVVGKKVIPYVSVGYSFSGGDDVKIDSYISAEGGVSIDNLSIGMVLGSSNIHLDSSTNYYIEPKITGSVPMGVISGTMLFGAGKYFNSSHTFIEYGGGVGYTHDEITYGVTYSNFDKIDYISISLTYSFLK